MNAKEYLGQAYRLDQHINSKLQQVEHLRELTNRVTVSYACEPVSRTRNVSSMEDTIIRLMEAEEDLNRQIDELVTLKMEMSELIGQVRNESYRLILEMRYLSFKAWDFIAQELNYSRRWVLKKHDLALAVVDKILEAKEQMVP